MMMGSPIVKETDKVWHEYIIISLYFSDTLFLYKDYILNREICIPSLLVNSLSCFGS